MKTNLEKKKELVMNAMDHYIESTKILGNSINTIQDDKLQNELNNMVYAVGSLLDAYNKHTVAVFEDHGWESYK